MGGTKNQPDFVTYVPAHRISTGESSLPATPEKVCVVAEVPLTIDVEGVETYTILCTPTDRLALAVGFLFTEGVIDSTADIEVLKVCEDDLDTIRVRLAGNRPRIDDAGRNLLIVSSCGACGSENLRQRIEKLPQVGDTLRIEGDLLRTVYFGLGKRQGLFKACGGTHAAAIFDAEGNIVSYAEDGGRHNALDKAIGKCLLAGDPLAGDLAPGDLNFGDSASPDPQAGSPLAGHGAALTCRLSLEMVSKCARAGIEVAAAVSATTSLAIDVAQHCNITLCAFVRETRATVFTYPHRIVGTSD